MASSTIFHEYLKPPRSINDYATEYAKQDVQRMQMDTARADTAETNALRAAIAAGADLSTPEGIAAIQLAAPLKSQALIKARAEQEAQRALTKRNTSQGVQSDAATQQKHLDMLKYFAGTVMANPTAENAMQALAGWELYTGKQMPGEREKIAQLKTPDEVRQWAAAHSVPPKDLLPQRGTPMNTGTNITTPVFNPVTQRMMPDAGVTMPVQVSPNTAATNTTSRQNTTDQINAQRDVRSSTAARNWADVPGGAPAPAPAGAPAPTQGFPRVAPSAQGAADQQSIEIISRKYLGNPQEMAQIDASIAAAQQGIRDAKFSEQRGLLERELQGMLLAKQSAGGAPAAPSAPVDREINRLPARVSAPTNPVASLAAAPAPAAPAMPTFSGSPRQRAAAENAWLQAQRNPGFSQPFEVAGPDGKPMLVRQDRQGNITPVDGIKPKSTAPAEKALPANAASKLFENQTNLRRAEQALALLQGKDVGTMKGDANATGFKGFIPDTVLQRIDSQGVDARAAIADLGSLVIHDRSGAAVTALEFPRLAPFIPSPRDDPETAKKKLNRFVQIYKQEVESTKQYYKMAGFKVPADSSLNPNTPPPPPGFTVNK